MLVRGKMIAVIGIYGLLTACAAITDSTPTEKMVLGCDGATQVIDVINDVIAADVVKVDNGEKPVLSLAALDRYEISKNIVVGYCTADVLDVTAGLPAVMRQYAELKLIEAGVK